ncbi:hypothetical protein BMF94_3876 [Rhodotorula taiwanensis]|uniref:Uncharacterized protein n=1 Tax=Rhodotorula taiwanensis TaxID=741276 RepID=A0A2S5B8D2_9BASI|nr:hypothetical protein BMF94_3876 [Rhodotorula taiwanensis]
MGLKSLLSKPSDSQPQQATLPPYSGNDAKTPVISQPPAIQAYGTANLQPIELHVYKEGSLFGMDDIITGPDKQQMQYYLHFPVKFLSGRWDLSLRQGGPQGPEICQIIKGGSWSNSFEIRWNGGAVTPVQQLGTFRMRYEFPASQEVYIWKSDNLMTSDYHFSLYKSSELGLPKEQRTLIAHWRTSIATFSKDGCLEIHPHFSHEVELILATALGVEVLTEGADALRRSRDSHSTI